MDEPRTNSWTSRMARFYDGFAPVYTLLREVGHRWDSQGKAHLIDHLAVKAGERVLDVGTGPGIYAVDLACSEQECRVVGIDVSPKFLDIARGRARRRGAPNIEFREGNVERLPFESDTFDKVICAGVISLVEDRKRALAEIHRVLRPGGMALLREPLQTGGRLAKLLAKADDDPTRGDWRDKVGLMFGNFSPRFFSEPEFEELLRTAAFAETAVHRVGTDLIGHCHK